MVVVGAGTPHRRRGRLARPHTIEKQQMGLPKEPVRIEVKEGRIASITGRSEAAFLAQVIERAGETARNIAEFALGTNPKCRLGAKLREAKKAWGSAQIGIGDNKSIGGFVDSPLHIDLIFKNPTVTVDDTVLVKDGKVVAWGPGYEGTKTRRCTRWVDRGTSRLVLARPRLEFPLPVTRPHGSRDYVDPAAVEQCQEALDLLEWLEREEK